MVARSTGRSAQLIERFIGHFLTEPKPSVWFDAPSTPAAISDWARPGSAQSSPGAAAGLTLVLDRRTRMLYRGDDFYINGEVVDLPRGAKRARAAASNAGRSAPTRRRPDRGRITRFHGFGLRSKIGWHPDG